MLMKKQETWRTRVFIATDREVDFGSGSARFSQWNKRLSRLDMAKLRYDMHSIPRRVCSSMF